MASEKEAKEKGEKAAAAEKDAAAEARPAAATARRTPWIAIVLVFALVVEPLLIIAGMFLLGATPGQAEATDAKADPIDEISGPIYTIEALTMSYSGTSGNAGICVMDVGIETPPDPDGIHERVLERVRPRIQESFQMIVLTRSRGELHDARSIEAVRGEFLDAVNHILLGPDEEGEAFARRVIIMKILFQ